ncbi:hypothetical protein FR483_n044R [Paramecium bursaria Chlorella virus FR483]|uniref:Uncharacterized protein n044R n=1 Tax=Paramecium bursaria Chlorella virus FR483 TaxID=399781 RepID=A7J698_PBCVF|nr:hypothetical protein FR483_n044R [Paramecium bursaria Chlorella virus FR483]ABT15329.1 hypothetical protein FR483_n044R [Paramecium bursaria Chlorella virus FR483]
MADNLVSVDSKIYYHSNTNSATKYTFSIHNITNWRNSNTCKCMGVHQWNMAGDIQNECNNCIVRSE